jgi:hypothetical protein
MWPEEFIRGANEKIAAKILYIGGYMRHRLHCVNVGPRAGFVCFCADRLYIIDRARQITGATDTDQFRPVRQNVIELIKIILEGFGIEWQPSDLKVKVTSQQQPGPDIRIVSHAREDDLIAGFETTSNRSRDMQGQRCHVLPEYDLVARWRVEKIRHCVARLVNYCIDHLRGTKVSLDVCI